MIVVNYFEVHKSDVSWKPYDVRKKQLVTWIEKIFHFIFIYCSSCFFFADYAIFYIITCQAEIKHLLTDIIS